jgi:hypothetical protein
VAKLNADLIDGVDGNSLQRRVDGGCGLGSSIRAIAPGGEVTCGEPRMRVVTQRLSGSAGTQSDNAWCAPGEHVTGGGYYELNADMSAEVDVSVPVVNFQSSWDPAHQGLDGWSVTATGSGPIDAYAVCMR